MYVIHFDFKFLRPIQLYRSPQNLGLFPNFGPKRKIKLGKVHFGLDQNILVLSKIHFDLEKDRALNQIQHFQIKVMLF